MARKQLHAMPGQVVLLIVDSPRADMAWCLVLEDAGRDAMNGARDVGRDAMPVMGEIGRDAMIGARDVGREARPGNPRPHSC